MNNKKVVVAASGKGRSLSNLIEFQKKWNTYEICGLIVSDHSCGAAAIAEKHAIPVYSGPIEDNLIVSEGLNAWLLDIKAHWIALAGYIKKFPVVFRESPEISKRMINIHPSLLPRFSGKGMYGMQVHEAVYQAKAKETGATIHYVNKNYDEGTVISQIKVPIKESDSVKEIASRVFQAECVLYPKTLTMLIQQKLPLKHNRIYELK